MLFLGTRISQVYYKNKLTKNKIRNKCKAAETVNTSLLRSLEKFNSLARNGSSESLNTCRLAISLSWRLNGHEKIDELIYPFKCWRSVTKALNKDHVMWQWLWPLGHVFQRSWHTFRLNDSVTFGLWDPIDDFFCGAISLLSQSTFFSDTLTTNSSYNTEKDSISVLSQINKNLTIINLIIIKKTLVL